MRPQEVREQLRAALDYRPPARSGIAGFLDLDAANDRWYAEFQWRRTLMHAVHAALVLVVPEAHLPSGGAVVSASTTATLTQVARLAAARERLRMKGDYAKADALRAELAALGVVVEDTKDPT